jgi:hypothetical protein
MMIILFSYYTIIQVLIYLVTFFKLTKLRLLPVHTSRMSIFGHTASVRVHDRRTIVEVNTRTKVLCPYFSLNYSFT